jgi:hypothetical protein
MQCMDRIYGASRAVGGVGGVDDEGVGGGHHALAQHRHADVPEVDAHLAHAQHRALVVLTGPHPLQHMGHSMCVATLTSL